MILLCCDNCHSVIYPQKRNWKWCKCLNIGGIYLYKGKHLISQNSKVTSRVIEVSNGVRYGYAKEGITQVIKKSNDIYEYPYPEVIDEKFKENLNLKIFQNRNALRLMEKHGKNFKRVRK